MRAAPLQPPSDPQRRHARRRAISLALTIGVHLLLLLMLIRLAPPLSGPPQAETATVFELEPDKGSAPKQAKAVAKKHASGGARAPTPNPRKTPPPQPPPVVPEATGPLKMMVLSQNDYRSADIGAMPKGASIAATGATSGAGSGDNSGDTAGAGTGPGGEKLYNAEWYREPTQAELATYLPRGAFGWGEIACRTVAGFRVEDCKELGNEPQGSGLARAVREAAWQFRVRPPRIGGKSMVGEWVRIHIDYREKTKG